MIQLIAETAWHHDGDLDFLKKLVSEICRKTKAHYVKFHITLDLDEYMYADHPAYQWASERVFKEKEWHEVFEIVKENKKKLMLLFNDCKSVRFGMQYNPDLVEVHSVCLNDIKLLKTIKEHVDNINTNLVLGVGGTDLYEIEEAINFLGFQNLTLMHGFQNYPTKYSDINFAKIKKIMSLYPTYKHGYADHTLWNHKENIFITLLGAGLGMHYIEKHVTNTPGEGRTDWQAAITINDFIKIEEKIKVLEDVEGNGFLKMNKGEQQYSSYGKMKKAAIINKNVKKGEALNEELIDFKRSNQESNMSQLDVVNSFGKFFARDILKGEVLQLQDLC